MKTESVLEALRCFFYLYRSVQTALLPKTDASEREIAFYRYSKALSHWPPLYQLSLDST